jgi:hypothetical protein
MLHRLAVIPYLCRPFTIIGCGDLVTNGNRPLLRAIIKTAFAKAPAGEKKL